MLGIYNVDEMPEVIYPIHFKSLNIIYIKYLA